MSRCRGRGRRWARRGTGALIGVLAALACRPGHAEPPAAFEVVGRDVVLPRGAVEGSLTLEADRSPPAGDSPLSLAPDVYAGVSDDLTLGISHSARSLSLVDSGFGLCLVDGGHGCALAYDDVALDARWALRGGALAAAARLRLVSRTFDPWKPSARVGALVRYAHGRFGIVADPQLQLGLVNRDRGNRDWLRLPLWLAFQPAHAVLLAVRTGIDGELATFGDTFAIPFALDAEWRVTARLDAALLIGFPKLLGPLNSLKDRHLAVTLTLRWP